MQHGYPVARIEPAELPHLMVLESGCTGAKGRQVACGLAELAYSCFIS